MQMKLVLRLHLVQHMSVLEISQEAKSKQFCWACLSLSLNLQRPKGQLNLHTSDDGRI